jgi:hypothetical protein
VKRAGEIFSSIFDDKLMKEADGYSSFFSCWKDLVEKNGIAAAAAHSWIKSVDKGLVWIEVDHPGWKQILQTKESKLLSDFHYRFPKMDISGISISLSRPITGSREPEQAGLPAEISAPEKSPPEGQAAVVSQAQNAGYEAIKDAALVEVLMRLERSIAEREAAE